MRKIAACVVAMSLAVCVTDVARAAEPFARVGPGYGAQWLSFPRGVRNVAMGATGTADVSGFATGYFNPASIAWSDATTLLGSYEDLYFDFNLSDAVITTPVPFHSDSTAGSWRFGGAFGYSRLGMEPQYERTIFLPDGTGSRTLDLDDWMLAATGAALWNRGVMSLGAGVAGKFVKNELFRESPTTWVMDLGAIAAFPIAVGSGEIRPRLGYSILNLDSGTEYDERTFYVANEQRGGFGLDLSAPPTTLWGKAISPVAISLDYDRTNREGSDHKYSGGFDLTLINMVHMRYGMIDSDYTSFGVGLGWDYGHVVFRADYAHTEFQEDPDDFFVDFDRDTFGALVGVRW